MCVSCDNDRKRIAQNTISARTLGDRIKRAVEDRKDRIMSITNSIKNSNSSSTKANLRNDKTRISLQLADGIQRLRQEKARYTEANGKIRDLIKSRH